MTDDATMQAIHDSDGELTVPGVLSVRPGFRLLDGRLTTTPAIVVTVTDEQVASRLPDSVGAVPVDVRVASARKRLRLEDPAAYARGDAVDPETGGVPEFPDELVPHADDAHVIGGHDHAAVHDGPALRPLAPLPDPFAAEDESGVGSRASARPELPYTAPDGVPLTPIEDTVTLRLSASPDSGWATLSEFLSATAERLDVAMYDFTSAHVLTAVEHAVTGRPLSLVLDHPAKNPTADQTDEQTVAALRSAVGDRFTQAWALERMDPKATAWVFPNAYHIKVAVRDGATTWLSSGNWNDSNQPDIDPVTVTADRPEARTRDRDWHLVVEHGGLAATFGAYIAHDLEVASAHNTAADVIAPRAAVAVPEVETPPFAEFFPATTISGRMRITPLLTPDPGVYVDAVRELIASATTSLHMQFQYIKLPRTVDATTQAFADLVDAVVARQRAGVDVRIIMSQWETVGSLEQLQTRGLDVQTGVRIQANVHNKGIVVDGRAALVSSQNWSGDGVLHNRDAGLIVEHPEVAAYFDRVFLHDWEHLATAKPAAD